MSYPEDDTEADDEPALEETARRPIPMPEFIAAEHAAATKRLFVDLETHQVAHGQKPIVSATSQPEGRR